MTVEEKKQALIEKFQRISDRVRHGNPNDFSLQLPLTLMDIDPEARTMTCSFAVSPHFCNPYGNAHGGIIATMLDIAQGAAIGVFGRENCPMVTVSLQISYLKPIAADRTLYIRSRITDLSDSMAFCTAEAWQESPAHFAASATSVYHIGHAPVKEPPAPSAADMDAPEGSMLAELLKEDDFKRTCQKWRSGQISARQAMEQLNMKPDQFYRTVMARGL